MTTPLTPSRRSKNRVRHLLGSVGVGEKIDLGRRHAKGFRISVGRTTAGTQCRIWLGQHEGEAQQRAQAIIAVWGDMAASGVTAWSPKLIEMAKTLGDQKVAAFRQFTSSLRSEYIAREASVEEFRSRISDIVEVPARPAVSVQQPQAEARNEPSLYGAMTAYQETLAGKRVSPSHRGNVRQILDRVKKHQPDVPISDIDFAFLDRLADHWKSRPVSPTHGTPLAPATVIGTLRELRAFFSWADDTSWGGWTGPRKLAKPFRCERKDLMTNAEIRKAGTIDQFTIPDLVKLYQAANDRERCIMLTALFSASTQAELSVMTKTEFQLDAGLLDHVRNKTGVRGLFWLPPELVTLLRKEFNQHRNQSLAFITRDDRPLVTFQGDKKTCDSVLQLWNRLKIKAGLTNALPFKYLRKFAGDYATRAGGESLGQTMLSHAPTTMLGRHYTSARDFDALHAIQQTMHADFEAAGVYGGMSQS
jgi:hypothetical protein